MNIANKLTISRIFLTFVFMIFLFFKGPVFKVLALLTFMLASWTDFLDGFLAKKRNEISVFGKFMDPIADKVLVISAFLAFVEMKLVPAWIIVIVVSREFIITGLRLIALAKGEIIEAAIAGKHKTVSQMLSIYVILLFIIFREVGNNIFKFWSPGTDHLFKNVIFFMMVITALLTLISGMSYIIKNKGLFLNHSQ
ncbi:MAG: CDP-diacylglycerol--glycerol-3-phosphate 3-phosphatidyltransferase [Candidatus Omnitrophica bacterium]|nr:CDP-diacylglycerol--glycerol-3-phosphate 3-phosphatidyltransferase [Candidatus Omnitrophota bacterium]